MVANGTAGYYYISYGQNNIEAFISNTATPNNLSALTLMSNNYGQIITLP